MSALLATAGGAIGGLAMVWMMVTFPRLVLVLLAALLGYCATAAFTATAYCSAVLLTLDAVGFLALARGLTFDQAPATAVEREVTP